MTDLVEPEAAGGAIGGKASGLVRLARSGPVPTFIVLDGDWLELNMEGLDGAVRERIAEEGMTGPLAVRSSAQGEDGHCHSFAGIYETVLGVSEADVGDAVRRVWRSADSDRVRAYKEARNLPAGASSMSVIVQEMVDAKVSGVAFSRDPEVPEVVVVEAVRGVGEELVAGHARPDLFRVLPAAGEVLEQHRGRQFAETLIDGSRRRLLGREVSEPRLTTDEAVSVARTVAALEAHFPEAGNGIDVEWAIDADGLKLLQCRPITTRAAGSPKGGIHA